MQDMKKIFYKIGAVIGVTFLVFLADSCLKDDRYVDFSSVGMVVEFQDASAGKAVGLSFADPTSAEADTVMVRVHQLGANATSQNITVTLGFSQAGLNTYNLDGSHVVGTALPSDAFSFPSTVTIVAGKDEFNNNNRTATFPLLIYPNKVPTTQGVNYVLSLGIVSASGGVTVSGNFGAILFNFYHNAYDGDYHSVGTRYDFAVAGDYAGWDVAGNKATGTIAATRPWNFPSTPVLTVNATRSTLHAGNDLSAFGTFDVIVNETTNEVEIVSTSATGLAALIPLKGPNALPSTWDPATKTFNLYYQYTNEAGTFRVLHDVLTHN
jgi:hypothetical protein